MSAGCGSTCHGAHGGGMIRVLHPFCWRIAGHAGWKPWTLIWKGSNRRERAARAVYWHFYYKR